MYIYHLPYEEMKELCQILDRNNKWEELGGVHMKFGINTLNEVGKVIYRGSSPTGELLTLWGHQNHTILELFVLLGRMKSYQAMTAIKHLIDQKYHCLIKEDVELDILMKNLLSKKKINIMDPKIRKENYNADSMKILNNKCIQIQSASDENNISGDVNHLAISPLAKSRLMTASDISSVAESAGAIPSIPYEELQKSTNNWDESTILGRGGFGKVYKGTWKCTQVAIKRLEQKLDSTEQIKQSITELHCLNAYRHDNVLPLYGYSIGGPHPCLIYQYMSGGSLDNRLRTRVPDRVLKWPARLNVAIGAARGLQFLHTNMINGKPLVHGDIKSANILLDPVDQPKIGDFGLAREGPQSQYTFIKVSRIHGTRPYLPDEFLRAKQFSTKVDTYAFGVVLFEIATSLPPYSDKREDKFLKDHVVNFEEDKQKLKDNTIEGYDSCFCRLLDIGKICVKKLAKERPNMVDVLIMLEQVPLEL